MPGLIPSEFIIPTVQFLSASAINTIPVAHNLAMLLNLPHSPASLAGHVPVFFARFFFARSFSIRSRSFWIASAVRSACRPSDALVAIIPWTL